MCARVSKGNHSVLPSQHQVSLPHTLPRAGAGPRLYARASRRSPSALSRSFWCPWCVWGRAVWGTQLGACLNWAHVGHAVGACLGPAHVGHTVGASLGSAELLFIPPTGGSPVPHKHVPPGAGGRDHPPRPGSGHPQVPVVSWLGGRGE